MKKIVQNTELRWHVAHIVLMYFNIIFFILGIIGAILVNFLSKCQVSTIDSNLSVIFGNDTVLEVFLFSLLMFSLILFFEVAYTRVLNNKFVNSNTKLKIRQQAEHNMAFALLFQFTFLISDDITRSCSAEIILDIILIMLIFNLAQVMYSVCDIAINDSNCRNTNN